MVGDSGSREPPARSSASPGRVLALIRLFLAAGVMRELDTVTATPSGTPQGSSLSPLLSNIALSVLDRRFEAVWAARTHDQRARDRAKGHPSYRMVRFADDFVRHEAPYDRAEMKGLRREPVAAGS